MTESQAGRMRAWMLVPYVSWCALGYAFLLGSDLLYLWHVPLHALTVLLVWKPKLLLPRKAKATTVHFLLVGVAYSAFIGQPLAVLGRGDLHPNLVLNGVLWIGSFAGVYLAWLWLLPRYRWSSAAIFALSGLLALFDHSLALWRMLANRDVVGLLVLAPVLHAVYAGLTAPVLLAYRERLSRNSAQPGLVGVVAGTLLPGLLFRLGSVWIWLASQVIHLAR